MSFTADRLLLFGATGDLAQRMLLPSLCALHDDKLIAPELTIIGTARSEYDDDTYQAFARVALENYLPDFRKHAIDSFLPRLKYQVLDATQADHFTQLSDEIGQVEKGMAIFLSTAPSLFEPTIAGLTKAGLTGDKVRIGLEKPLGTSLETSREINDAVAAAFSEDRIFRIDHYLSKETVQNHMLQLLALVAMEPPTSYEATPIQDEKVKVLRALRVVAPTETVTGQYRKGAIEGQPVPGYDEELGKPSDTETFVAIKAHVDNWRWTGVPFYLRTGKRLPERKTEIVVNFRCIPHSIFAARGAKTQPNALVIGIQPEENIQLQLMAKEPGLDRDGIRLRPVPLNITMPDAFAGPKKPIAYERLLLDLIEGDQTLFVRRDEVEAQWGWIDQIRASWAEHEVKPKAYSAGNWGPSAAIALAERDGVTWHD